MSNYRKRLLEEVRRRGHGTGDQMSFARSAAEDSEARFAALAGIPGLFGQESLDLALSIVEEHDASPSLRALALEKAASSIGKSETLIERVIEILLDATQPREVRLAALGVLQVNSFSSPILLGARPNYLSALRTLVSDPEMEIRKIAIETLALGKDEYVQRKLLEGLRDTSKSLIGPELAITFLSYDLHAEHYQMLREIVQSPPNAGAKKAAIRALAIDPRSQDFLDSILTNKDEAPEIRHASAVSLHRVAPSKMISSSKAILEDSEENEELKVALLNSLIHVPETGVGENKAMIDALGEAAKEESTKLSVAKLRKRVED